MTAGAGVRVTRFTVLSEDSQLVAHAHSSIHAFTYRAPLTGEIRAAISDAGFDLTTAVTGNLEVDLALFKGDDPHTDGEMHRRLDTHRYPRAKAVVNEVSHNGGDVYHLSGTLTMRGRTQPLEGDATVTLVGGHLHANGSITVDVRDYDIKPPSLVILRVNPEVMISIDLVAKPSED